MDLLQNYCFLIRAHFRGLGCPNFLSKKCSLENVNNSVQISSPQLLLSKRYSRLKLPFYNRFKKCSLENVNNSVQISSPQFLLSKRYSRLKLPFYNRFAMGDTPFYIRFTMGDTPQKVGIGNLL